MRDLLPGDGDVTAADLQRRYLEVPRPARSDRPWVVVNFVVSPDGSAATAGRVGGLSGSADQQLLRTLRAAADVILVGAATVRAEDYGPHRPTAAQREARLARGQQPSAVIAVVSASLRLDPAARLFTGTTRPLLVRPATTAHPDPAVFDKVADTLVAGDTSVDLPTALRALHARGTRLVVCEGGPDLLGQLLADDLVDELCLTVAPTLVADPTRLLVEGALPAPRPLTLAHVLEDDGHLFLRYLVDDHAGTVAG